MPSVDIYPLGAAPLCFSKSGSLTLCVCVCVCVRERERARQSACLGSEGMSRDSSACMSACAPVCVCVCVLIGLLWWRVCLSTSACQPVCMVQRKHAERWLFPNVTLCCAGCLAARRGWANTLIWREATLKVKLMQICSLLIQIIIIPGLIMQD